MVRLARLGSAGSGRLGMARPVQFGWLGLVRRVRSVRLGAAWQGGVRRGMAWHR